MLGNVKKGQLFVISAPAGTGKSTLVEKMVGEFPDVIAESCSTTTRSPRPGEIKGQHYDFVSKIEFEQLKKKGAFLEHAEVFGDFYGTRTDEILRLENEGKHVILVIDTQGAMQVKRKMEATFIFISPPSHEELKKRLINRKTEDSKTIEKRLAWAKEEMNRIPFYDYHIVNDDLEITYQILKSIFIAQEHKRK